MGSFERGPTESSDSDSEAEEFTNGGELIAGEGEILSTIASVLIEGNAAFDIDDLVSTDTALEEILELTFVEDKC